jgi:ABC-type transport system involved in cytochrome c biogenesis permease subunit
MAVTIATWTVYASSLALRHLAGWRGRRAAYLILAGFVLVAVVRLALPVTHFAT